MDDFPSNSRKPNTPLDKTPPPDDEAVKLEKVVTGSVIRRRKPLGRRIMDTFFSGDSTSVVGYLGKEVLLPALQNLITDFVTQGIERAVYGEVQTPRRNARGGATGRPLVSYNTASTVRPAATSNVVRRPVVRQVPATDLGEIVLPDLNQTQIVIENLYRTVEEYGCATVSNLKELIGETSLYTDHKWGWTDLTDLTAKRVREGYLLIIPDPEDLR